MQTSVSYDPQETFEGMVEYPQHGLRLSGLCSVAIPYGKVIVRDTAGASAKSAKLPVVSADLTTAAVLGISVRREFCPAGAYTVKTGCTYVRHGFIWVLPENTLVVGAKPFVRFTVGAAGTVLGAFRNDADTAKAVQVSFCTVFEVRNGFALLEVDALHAGL